MIFELEVWRQNDPSDAGRFETYEVGDITADMSFLEMYALWWIKATIHEYILRSWSLVKIGTTAAQKKLFFRLRSEMRKLGGNSAILTPEMAQSVADKLKVSVRDVVEMDCRLGGDLSLNTRVGNEDRSAEWEAILVDESSGCGGNRR